MFRMSLICLAVSAALGASALPFQIGAASVVVTPPNGVYLAGYDHDRRATGVHDDLFAKAVIVANGKDAVCLVVIDSIGVSYPTINEIRALASKQLTKIAIAPERIVVSSTHTHCGPDCIGVYGKSAESSGIDSAYMKLLVEGAAKAVVDASEKLQEAEIRIAETKCEGWAVNDSEPDLVDHSVTVAQCVSADGKSIATLTNFACHPTVLDGDTTVCSADWPGAFYRTMSESIEGEHIFLQGCIGGWVQPVTPIRTFELALAYGKHLADITLASLRTAKPLTGDSIRFANKVFAMPNTNEGFKALSASGVLPRAIGDTVETEVAWFSIGEAQFATHPGETSPAHGFATKEMMATGPKFVIGLGLDELGYILKKDYFEKGKYPHADYLTSVSPGPGAEDAMLAALREIIPGK